MSFLVLFISCKQHEADSFIPTNLNENNSFYENLSATYVGDQHNLILNFILEDLKLKESISKQDITNSAIQYLKKEGVQSIEVNQYFAEKDYLSNEKYNAVNSTVKDFFNNSNISFLIASKNKEQLNNKNASSFDRDLYLLDDKMERKVIEIAIETGKSSIKFWENYIDSKKYKKQYPPIEDCIDAGAIAASDAIGAAAGATHLAISGTGAALVASGPWGWVGAGLVVAAEAAIASAAAFYIDSADCFDDGESGGSGQPLIFEPH